MKINNTFKTICVTVAFIICMGLTVLITVKAFATAPLTAEDITDGKIHEVFAYEEFNDFVDTDSLPDIFPIQIKQPKYIYVEMPYGGCKAILNPINAVDKDGNILYSLKLVKPNVFFINIDGRCIAYRAIENAAAK